jgi:hypothetical protein
MWKRDYRDIVTGAFFLLLGGFAAIYATYTYRLGSFGTMGPGMFPAIVGTIVALLGAGILIPALFEAGPKPEFDLRSALTVLAGVAAFAAFAAPLGLVPATFLLTSLSMLADSRVSIRTAIVLSVTLSVLAYAIFTWGLGIPLPAWHWPF